MAYQPTQAERDELAQVQAYLKGHAEAGTTPKEGSFTRVLRLASPNVKAHILANKEFGQFLDQGGRSMPFADRFEQTGPVPKDVQAVRDQLKTEEVAAGLLDRMGTTNSQKQQFAAPPTMREHVAAAFNAVVGQSDSTQQQAQIGEQHGN